VGRRPRHMGSAVNIAIEGIIRSICIPTRERGNEIEEQNPTTPNPSLGKEGNCSAAPFPQLRSPSLIKEGVGGWSRSNE